MKITAAGWPRRGRNGGDNGCTAQGVEAAADWATLRVGADSEVREVQTIGNGPECTAEGETGENVGEEPGRIKHGGNEKTTSRRTDGTQGTAEIPQKAGATHTRRARHGS